MPPPPLDDMLDLDEVCPICVEPFDESDKLFLPCVCNYRVCMFCVRRLMTEFDGRCPGCRTNYDESKFRIKQLDAEEIERQKRERAERKRLQERERARIAAQAKVMQQQQLQQAAKAKLQTTSTTVKKSSPVHGPTVPPPPLPAPHLYPSLPPNGVTAAGTAASFHQPPPPVTSFQPQRQPTTTQTSTTQSATAGNVSIPPFSLPVDERTAALASVRVVQRNLVFVMGLSPSLAREDILRRPQYFGQYGQILKVSVIRGQGSTPQISAYIRYVHPEDARTAILGVDGLMVDGHLMRASFGTAKYCAFFLRGMSCPNSECLSLHFLGDELATFTREEMESGKLKYEFLDAIADTEWASSSSPPSTTSPPAVTTNGTSPPPIIETSMWPTPSSAVQLLGRHDSGGGSNNNNNGKLLPQSDDGTAAPTKPNGSLLPPPFERLGGMDLATYEKQRHVPAKPMVMSRAPGGEIPISVNDSTAFTEILGLAANLIANRAPVSSEVKAQFGLPCGPRVSSFGYSGLKSVLSSNVPYFVAPPTWDINAQGGGIGDVWSDNGGGNNNNTTGAPYDDTSGSGAGGLNMQSTSGNNVVGGDATKRLSRKARKTLARGLNGME